MRRHAEKITRTQLCIETFMYCTLYSTAWHDVFLYPGGWCFSNVFNYNNKIVFENRSSVSFTDLRAKKLYVCCDEEKRNLFR